MTKLLMVVLTILLFQKAYNQAVNTDNTENVISDRLEILASIIEEEEFDYALLTERLSFYLQNPIQLDEKCAPGLKELQLLNNIQINEILAHIKTHGSIFRIEELQQIQSLNVNDILNIAPFIGPNPSTGISLNSVDKKATYKARFRYSKTIQDSRGYRESKYKGPNYGLYTRYDFKYDNIFKAGITLEKDAGELLYRRRQLSDFQSAFLLYQGKRDLRKVIVGDFKAGFGQGLSFTNSGGVSKSSDVLLINRSFDAITPYRSINESGYLRGMALEYKRGRLITRSFFSRTQQDATINNGLSTKTFSSLSLSGLHRTENEISKINTLTINTLCLAPTYAYTHGELGLIAVQRTFSLPSERKNELHNQTLSSAQKMTVLGLHFRYSKNNLSTFSEISHSFSKGNAGIFGLLFMPDKNVGISLLARHFENDYTAISSASFAEKSQSRNETGLYSGIKISLPKHLTLSAFADVFSFKNPTFQSDMGGKGLDYFIEIKRKNRKNKEWLMQLKWHEKPKDVAMEGLVLKAPYQETNKRIRFQYQCYLNEALRFRGRLEFSEYLLQTITEQGMLMFQELKFTKLGVNWSALLRYTLFDTEGYQSRIYTYEQHVQGAYSIPSFSGKGSKIMGLINYKFTKGLKISIKMSQLIYDDRSSIGTGLNEIEGPEKTEITAQIDFTF